MTDDHDQGDPIAPAPAPAPAPASRSLRPVPARGPRRRRWWARSWHQACSSRSTTTTRRATVWQPVKSSSRGADAITTEGDIAAILQRRRARGRRDRRRRWSRQRRCGGHRLRDLVRRLDRHQQPRHRGRGRRSRPQFSDGRKLTAKVLGRDPSSDLAVIKVEGANLQGDRARRLRSGAGRRRRRRDRQRARARGRAQRDARASSPACTAR